MRTCGSCGTWIPEAPGPCPSCGRDPGSAPPPPPPPPAPPSAGEPGGPDPLSLAAARRTAGDRVRRLGWMFLVLGGLVLLLTLLSFLEFASGEALRNLAEARRDPEVRSLLGDQADEVFDGLQTLYESPLYLSLAHSLPFALGVLLAAAGWRLRALRGRILGIVAAVAALVLSPAASCCCCAAAPLGIHALLVLTREDTRLAMAVSPGASRGPSR